MNARSSRPATVALAITLAACSGPSAVVDAATSDVGVDAGTWLPMDLPVLAHGTRSPTDPAALDPATALPGNWTCLGTAEGPPVGAVDHFTYAVADFQTRAPIEGACVRAFPDRIVLDATCAATDVRSDMAGVVAFDLPSGGMMAFEIFALDAADPAMRYVPTLLYDVPAAPGQQLIAVSEASLNLIPVTTSHVHGMGKATVGGIVTDCDNVPAFGVAIRVADPDGDYLAYESARTGFEVGYFDGSMRPSGSGRWTQADGLYFAANVPVPADGRPIFVEGWGRVADGEEPRLVYCQSGRVLADGTTLFFSSRPLRVDGPHCPAMAATP